MLKRYNSIVERKFNSFIAENRPVLEQLYQTPQIYQKVSFPAFCSFAFDFTYHPN